MTSIIMDNVNDRWAYDLKRNYSRHIYFSIIVMLEKFSRRLLPLKWSSADQNVSRQLNSSSFPDIKMMKMVV